MHRETTQELEVIQDRLRVGADGAARLSEALEAALRAGHGRIVVHALGESDRECASWRYSSDLHCAECDLHYQDALPSLFSFNSPIGACETCRGFGRVIGIDYGLVIPDPGKSLREGAIRPWQTPSFKECPGRPGAPCQAPRGAAGCAVARFTAGRPRLGNDR